MIIQDAQIELCQITSTLIEIQIVFFTLINDVESEKSNDIYETEKMRSRKKLKKYWYHEEKYDEVSYEIFGEDFQLIHWSERENGI